MNRIQVVRKLLDLSKRGEKQACFDLLQKSKILKDPSALAPIDISQIIYSFSKLDVKDPVLWKNFEMLFLQKEKQMNMTDIVMCAYAFCKQTKNVEIWKAIERAVTTNFFSWKQQQFEHPNIGMALQSFLKGGQYSKSLWDRLEFIVLDTVRHLDDKNLALSLQSLTKMNRINQKIVDTAQEKIKARFERMNSINRALVIQAQQKANAGDDELWSIFERVVVPSCLENPKKRDMAHQLWCFSHRGKGSEQFWLNMQNVVLKQLNIQDLSDQTAIAHCFQLLDKGDKDFWNKMGMFSNLKRPKHCSEERQYSEICLLGKQLFLKGIGTPEIWNELGSLFQKMSMKRELVLSTKNKLQNHECIYKILPHLVNPEIEQFQIEKIKNTPRNEMFIILTDAIQIANQNQYCSDAQWKALSDLFQQQMQNQQNTGSIESQQPVISPVILDNQAVAGVANSKKTEKRMSQSQQFRRISHVLQMMIVHFANDTKVLESQNHTISNPIFMNFIINNPKTKQNLTIFFLSQKEDNSTGKLLFEQFIKSNRSSLDVYQLMCFLNAIVFKHSQWIGSKNMTAVEEQVVAAIQRENGEQVAGVDNLGAKQSSDDKEEEAKSSQNISSVKARYNQDANNIHDGDEQIKNYNMRIKNKDFFDRLIAQLRHEQFVVDLNSKDDRQLNEDFQSIFGSDFKLKSQLSPAVLFTIQSYEGDREDYKNDVNELDIDLDSQPF